MDTKVYLSDAQIKKIKGCYDKKQQCKLRIDLHGTPKNKTIKLTQQQMLQLEIAKKQKKKTCDIELSPTQIGGFLPFLIPAAIAAAKALGIGAVGALGAKAINKLTGKGTQLPGKQNTRKNFLGYGIRIPGKKH